MSENERTGDFNVGDAVFTKGGLEGTVLRVTGTCARVGFEEDMIDVEVSELRRTPFGSMADEVAHLEMKYAINAALAERGTSEDSNNSEELTPHTPVSQPRTGDAQPEARKPCCFRVALLLRIRGLAERASEAVPPVVACQCICGPDDQNEWCHQHGRLDELASILEGYREADRERATADAQLCAAGCGRFTKYEHGATGLPCCKFNSACAEKLRRESAQTKTSAVEATGAGGGDTARSEADSSPGKAEGPLPIALQRSSETPNARPAQPGDWTDGNKSPAYLHLVERIAERLANIRVGDSLECHARTILSGLAHIHDLAPRTSGEGTALSGTTEGFASPPPVTTNTEPASAPEAAGATPTPSEAERFADGLLGNLLAAQRAERSAPSSCVTHKGYLCVVELDGIEGPRLQVSCRATEAEVRRLSRFMAQGAVIDVTFPDTPFTRAASGGSDE